MKDQTKTKWQELCAQATVEEDPKKLSELNRQIGEMFEEKEERLKGERAVAEAKTPELDS
jgi:hypothetical protein